MPLWWVGKNLMGDKPPHSHFCLRCCLGCSFRVWLRCCLVAVLAAGVPLAVGLEFEFEFALPVPPPPGSCASEWLTLPHAQSALPFLLLAVGGLLEMTSMSL